MSGKEITRTSNGLNPTPLGHPKRTDVCARIGEFGQSVSCYPTLTLLCSRRAYTRHMPCNVPGADEGSGECTEEYKDGGFREVARSRPFVGPGFAGQAVSAGVRLQ